MRKRFFEWVEGDSRGFVETLDKITMIEGQYFYNFISGEVCNMRFISKMTKNPADLRGKVMVEVPSPSDTWTFGEITTGKFKDAHDELIEYPPLEDIVGATGTGDTIDLGNSQLGKKKMIPPKYRGEMWGLPNIDDYFVDDESTPMPEQQQVPAQPVVLQEPAAIATPAAETLSESLPVDAPVYPAPGYASPQTELNPTPALSTGMPAASSDPIQILAKTCKKHSTEVKLTVTIDLPSKSVYSMVNDEFENGGPAFVDCLISQIDVNEIIDSLRDALLVAYTKADVAQNEQ